MYSVFVAPNTRRTCLQEMCRSNLSRPAFSSPHVRCTKSAMHCSFPRLFAPRTTISIPPRLLSLFESCHMSHFYTSAPMHWSQTHFYRVQIHVIFLVHACLAHRRVLHFLPGTAQFGPRRSWERQSPAMHCAPFIPCTECPARPSLRTTIGDFVRSWPIDGWFGVNCMDGWMEALPTNRVVSQFDVAYLAQRV
jgi:hypothetical protein